MTRARGDTIAFTIADAGLTAHASVLLRDLARVQPRWPRAIVSAEGLPLAVSRGTRRLTATDVRMTEWVAFAVNLPRASALAALVPWTFDALFAQGYERVIYLGPQVRCYAPLTELHAALKTSEAAIVPRVLHAFTDSLIPGARELRASGLFDPSLVGLSASPGTARCWPAGWTRGATAGCIPIAASPTTRRSRSSS